MRFCRTFILDCLTSMVVALLLVSPSIAQTQVSSSNPLEQAFQLSKQERWKDAIPLFEQALKKDPANALAQANLGVAYSRAERHKEALFAYEKALHMGYDTASFRYFRGLSFAKLNLLEEAAKEMETALEMDVFMPETIYDLGLVYTMMNRNEDALELVKKLYRRNNTLSEKLFRKIPSTYTIASIDNGGTLLGRVLLKGKVPKPRAFHLVHSPNIEFCSRISDGRGHRILHDFVVGPTGGLKDTVISILGVKKGKPIPTRMQTFHVDRCRASQYAIGIRNGEDILLENTDPIRHEIATYQIYNTKVRQTSNRPVDSKTTQVRSAFVKPGTQQFIMKCNLHPFLQTHGVFVDNPYYTITDEEGKFEIKDIPEGTYEVVAWHPFIPEQKGTITIKPGGEVQLNFEFKGEDERRRLYQNDTKGYRFNTWFDSGKKFYGEKRVDDPVEILQKFDNSDRYVD